MLDVDLMGTIHMVKALLPLLTEGLHAELLDAQLHTYVGKDARPTTRRDHAARDGSPAVR